jgi:hypothetical protein
MKKVSGCEIFHLMDMLATQKVWILKQIQIQIFGLDILKLYGV